MITEKLTLFVDSGELLIENADFRLLPTYRSVCSRHFPVCQRFGNWSEKARLGLNTLNGYLLGSYRIATVPEPNSSRLTSLKSTGFDRPANNVGP
jgi:hypothetical protein